MRVLGARDAWYAHLEPSILSDHGLYSVPFTLRRVRRRVNLFYNFKPQDVKKLSP